MDVGGTHYRTIWVDDDEPEVVRLIDQRRLPFDFVVEEVRTTDGMVTAIAEMWVRGAGLIGAAAGYGMYLAALAGEDPADAAVRLKSSRPTAVNLAWAVDRQLAAVGATTGDARVKAARVEADAIADEDAEAGRAIGEHGHPLIEEIHESTGRPVDVLTHCNAGWLAFVDHGSALAPVYAAHDAGIPVHVWVDETRPRNQGSRLTAWELGAHGVPHTVIVDNAGGQLMQDGRVDLCVVGSDRTTRAGDVVNKIGTYLKALAAHDNGVPFHVALPSSSIDWSLRRGADVPIEERAAVEVTEVDGQPLVPEGTAAANPTFDVTPSRLVTGLVTERGRCAADEASITALFPEQA